MGVVERDDGLVEWTGLLGRQLRPMAEADARSVLRVILVMYVFAVGPTAFITFGWIPTHGVERGRLLIESLPATAGATVYFAWLLRQHRPRFLRAFPATTVVAYFVAIGSLSRGLGLSGAAFGVIAVYYVEAPLIVFYVLRPRWAIAYTALMMGFYALGLHFTDGVESRPAHWTVVFSAAVVSGFLMGGLASRLQEARTQLSRFNARLRRFLAPQVADALAMGDESLAPHRAEIVAMFVDLRGFTAFTNVSTPDRVVAVLDEYDAAVGAVVEHHNGTVGGFEGDGVFAFVGDPVPHENPAATAVAIAREVASALEPLTGAWGDLGYGIGLAFGEATVGLVGFEGRVDYTPVGACVNLAARLCAAAKHGEIVIDEALRDAAGLNGSAAPRGNLDLKGFGATQTYTVRH